MGTIISNILQEGKLSPWGLNDTPIVIWQGSGQTEPHTSDCYEFQARVHCHWAKLPLKPQEKGWDSWLLAWVESDK